MHPSRRDSFGKSQKNDTLASLLGNSRGWLVKSRGKPAARRLQPVRDTGERPGPENSDAPRRRTQ
jgi:hypothetical protein